MLKMTHNTAPQAIHDWVIRPIKIGVGIVLLAAGSVLTLTPVPLGLIMILIGTVLLVSSSMTFRRAILSLRSGSSTADLLVHRIEALTPRHWSRDLRLTNPNFLRGKSLKRKLETP